MKITDYLLPLAGAVLFTAGLHYFFQPAHDKQSPTAVVDKSFIAPASVQVAEPLDFDVDFSDAPSARPVHTTSVTTPLMQVDFTNNGATIERLVYKRTLAGKPALMETVVPTNREQGAFLLALNGLGSTPYYYTLIDNKTTQDSSVISYTGESDKAKITKQFTISHSTYEITLNITVEPKVQDKIIKARLFFPAPLPVDADTDAIKAVLSKENGALEKKALKDVIQLGKERPSFFGLETRYFINTLLRDPQGFAQRAYFKTEGANKAQAVLQTGQIQQKTSYTLVFYCGPKDVAALSAVDKRLEKVLDYGLLAPLSKPLLYALNFLYSYVKNYGFAILLLTLCIKLLMAPLLARSERTMRQQTEVQKKLKYIEQKYKHDPETLAREKAEFVKKHGIPGMLGCLPLLLQIPIFIGLNRVLSNSIELYKAPFVGWIQDLSAPDPYYILPALVGLGMVLQATQTGGSDPRQRVSSILLAFVVAAATSSLSAGLVLFIAASTLLGIVSGQIARKGIPLPKFLYKGH